MKIRGIMIAIIQIAVLIIMFFKSKEFLLLDYINISFVFGGSILFLGLCIYVLSSGFFDIFTTSMRKVFTFKHNAETMKDFRPPSELVTISSKSFLQVGGITLLLMIIALGIYYV